MLPIPLCRFSSVGSQSSGAAVKKFKFDTVEKIIDILDVSSSLDFSLLILSEFSIWVSKRCNIVGKCIAWYDARDLQFEF